MPRVTPATVHVDETQYRFSHGRSPRGFGYWAFSIASETRWIQDEYRKARRQACREAVGRGVFTIKVLP